MRVANLIPDPGFIAGLVLAQGTRVGPAPQELQQATDELVLRRSQEDFPPADAKAAVRNLLKKGGFKPSGRNKPASEYLAQAAREGRFPRINNLVDINNLVSLETGLPISLLDARALAGEARLRYGRPGEKYVFNSAGQEIDLAGLICVCGGSGPDGEPLGNPVKDSIAGKLKADTDCVLAVIYAAKDSAAGCGLAAHAERFSRLLKDWGGAAEAKAFVLQAGQDLEISF